MKRVVLFLVIVFLSHSLYSEEAKQILEWEAHPAAIEYKIVIYRGNQPLQEEYTAQTRIELSLEPGVYNYTVTVINKFRSESGTTRGTLRVEEVPQPILKDMYPQEIYLGEGPVVVNLQAYQVFESARFVLTGEGVRQEGLLLNINNNVYQIQYSEEGLEPGQYRIEVENPAGVTALTQDTFTLRYRPVPEFSGMGQETGYIGEIYTRIIINGSGFEEGAEVYFQRGDDRLDPVSVEYFSENQLFLWLDLREEERAKYDIVIRNPSGGETVHEKVFKVDYSPDYYWKEKNFGSDFMISALAIPSIEKDWWPYWGAEVKYNLDFTDKKPVWRWFGFEAKVGWIYLDATLEGYSLYGGCSLYLRTRFNFPLNFLIKAGLGGHWLNSEIFSGNGPYFMTAAALDFNIFRNFFFQLESGFHYVLFADNYVLLLANSISIGYRF